jgi:anti-anti-sigma regulatory factor
MSEILSIAGARPYERTLKLVGDVGVFLAADLHRCCVQISREASSVTIDCRQAASLDVAALQILVALKDSLAAQGGTFAVTGMAADVTDAVHLAGLGGRLGIDDGPTSEGSGE